MTDAPPPKRRRWRLRLWHLMAIMPLAAVATVWLLLPPRGPRAPVQMVRGPDGHLRAERGDLNRRGPLDVNAATIEAETPLASGHGGSGAVSYGAFADRSLLILNLSDHPLLRQLGGALLEEFDAYGPFERVDFLPPGFVPEPGRYAPDLVLTLDLADFDEEVGPLRHVVDATIAVRVFNEQSRGGDSAAPPSSSGLVSPPLAGAEWEGVYEHDSTTTGPVPSPQRYGLAGAAIAESIAPDLIRQFESWAEVHGRLPRLPDAFRPPYREPVAVPPLDDLGAERIYATRGLMRHNTTAWRFTDERPTAAVLRDLRDRCAAIGWEGGDSLSAGSTHLDLRLGDGPETLRAYRVEPVRVPGVPPDPDEPSTFEVLYVDSMTIDEARAAADRLLDDPDVPVEALPMLQGIYDDDQRRRAVTLLDDETPTDVLLSFSSISDAGQNARLLELLEGRTIEDPDDWRDLARIRGSAGRPGPELEALRETFVRSGWPVAPLDRLARSDALAAEGRHDEAVAALREAALLDVLLREFYVLNSAIFRRAERLGVRTRLGIGLRADALVAGADDDAVRAAGFVEVVPDAGPLSGTIGPGVPGLFFARWPDGRLELLALVFHDEESGSLHVMTRRPHGRSHSSRPRPRSSHPFRVWTVPGLFAADISLEYEERLGRIRYTLEVRPDPAAAPDP